MTKKDRVSAKLAKNMVCAWIKRTYSCSAKYARHYWNRYDFPPQDQPWSPVGKKFRSFQLAQHIRVDVHDLE